MLWPKIRNRSVKIGTLLKKLIIQDKGFLGASSMEAIKKYLKMRSSE
jgi:hypothetical protein